MSIIRGNFLSPKEVEIVNKFRKLDGRGKASVMSHLDHQYMETQKERREEVNVRTFGGGKPQIVYYCE